MNIDKIIKSLNYIVAIFKAFLWLAISMILSQAAMLQAIEFATTYSTKFDKNNDKLVQLEEAIVNTESALMYMIFVSLSIFMIMYIIDSYVIHKDSLRIKQFKISGMLKMIPLGIALNTLGSIILVLIPHKIITDAGYSVNLNIYTSLFSMVICVGIATPICEELIFRYFIYNSVKYITNTTFAIIMSSLVFGLAHKNPVQSIYTFIYGIIFASLNTKYNSILPGIILHITINTLTAILTVENQLSTDNIHELMIVISLFVGSALISIVVTAIERMRKHKDVQF